MTDKELYINIFGFTEEEYDKYMREMEVRPKSTEEEYRHTLALANHWISEEDFLRIIRLVGAERTMQLEKLSKEQVCWFTRLKIIYQQLLRERGELKD